MLEPLIWFGFGTTGQTAFDILLNPFQLYTLPLADWISAGVNLFVDNFRPLFQAIRVPINGFLNSIELLLIGIPPSIFLLGVGLLAWKIAGRGIAIYSIVAMTLIGFVGLWQPAMVTLALVLTAVAFCITIGIPIGIFCGRNDRLEMIVQPILDTMQTLPRFVYLVPVVMLFGIGEVPGFIATVIVAAPPLIRLTNLGLRQVSPGIGEAATALGLNSLQALWLVYIPLAMPSILAGINQTIVFALAMSVVVALIAVPGLGLVILEGVGRLDVGTAAVGGIAIALLAIMVDRITKGIAGKSKFSALKYR
ncbi:MAG: ABC transporter permease subunit [Cyanobacteria bacterium J06639_14]